jgi:hypothetical protein
MSAGCMRARTARAEPRPDLARKQVQRRQAHLERQDRIRAEAGRLAGSGIGAGLAVTGARALRSGVTTVPAWPRAWI